MATHSRDGGAWWAAVYGIAQSWIRLNRLSSSTMIYLRACLMLWILPLSPLMRPFLTTWVSAEGGS